MRLRMAEDLWQRFQLQRVWNVWLRRCEHSEELKLHSVSRKARAHHNFQLKRKLFAIWVRYCQWRRFRKFQYGKADYHFRERALPRYFCRMMIFVDLIHSKKENNLAAEKFRREALLAKMFYSWWRKYQLMMDVRMMERMAILHNDEVIKRRSIQFWLQRARSKLHERKLEAVADDHRNRKLLLMGITRWREFDREMKQSRSVQHSSVRHYYIHLLRKTWAAWQQFVHHRQVKWQKQARADLLYQRNLLSVVISAWKGHHKHVKVVETHSDERLQAHNLDRLRSTFETWKRNAEANKEERRNKHVAKTLFNQTLLSKCFSCWKEFSTHHAVKKWQQWQRIQEIQQKLARGKLHRSFRAWKSFKLKSVRDKTLRNKACDHHNKTLQRKAVQAWKGYIHLCFRIKILERQSMWIHNRRITAAFFKKWKKQHAIVVQEKRKTVLALWHWSVNLQRKAFYGLLEYAISRKRKEVRIARALEERRNRLLRTGVTQWMKVGFHLASERSRLAQERQLEAAYSVHQCVYRCAMHWRRVTANRVRQRGGKPRPRPVIEPKSDWPVAKLPVTTRSVPSIQPSAYTMEVHRIASEGFKERPRPRKPDYLRESFDFTQISIATNVSPRVPSTRVTDQVDDDETKPRSSPPRPSYQMRSNIHPHQRNPRDESIVFPSSSGEESFPGAERSKQTRETVDSSEAAFSDRQHGFADPVSKPVQKPSIPSLTNKAQARGPERRVVLLPPSSFTLPSRAEGAQMHPSVPEGLEVLASTSPYPASTPRTSLESEKRLASSPSSATSLSSRGSEDEEEAAREDEEEEIDEEQDDEECKPNTREEAVRSELPSQLKGEGNLQERVAAMKNILQEFQDIKVTYSHKKKQRDQLSVWVQEQVERLGPNHEDDELLQTEQCLHELTEEVHNMAERIRKTRPLVEEVASSIRELIQKTGLGSSA
ncbi:protein SFI1 homolog [Orbicella faveolata]|uniref:protein SFI1 homolog n=1 Tax=Orbicella faveolata TaxID=48498 RepID=UPI0009E2350C|nr:protein SFI1 homolog [Orbicella faveolata]